MALHIFSSGHSHVKYTPPVDIVRCRNWTVVSRCNELRRQSGSPRRNRSASDTWGSAPGMLSRGGSLRPPFERNSTGELSRASRRCQPDVLRPINNERWHFVMEAGRSDWALHFALAGRKIGVVLFWGSSAKRATAVIRGAIGGGEGGGGNGNCCAVRSGSDEAQKTNELDS